MRNKQDNWQDELPLYDGNGETIGQRRPSSSYQRHYGAQQGKQPLGYSRELQDKHRYYGRYASPQEDYEPDGSEYQEHRYPEENRPRYSPASGPEKKKHSHPIWWFLALLFLLCDIALVWLILPQILGVELGSVPTVAFVNGTLVSYDGQTYQDYRNYRQYMDTDSIFPGIFIDDLDVGGLTPAQAEAALMGTSAGTPISFDVKVKVGNASWSISSKQVPTTRNISQVVQRAYSLGRSNTPDIRGTGTTPFKERLNTVMDLRSHPVPLYTEETYDHDMILGMANAIAESVNREPVNSAVESFDFNTMLFSFTMDETGTYVDPQEIYQKVISAIDQGNTTAELSFVPKTLLAEVTKSDLINRFGKISSYSTKTTSNKNRNKNIQLSAAAINGTTVLPGTTFSFNQATGERTAEKGYLPAAAISGGQSKDEIGGGVCQTSSTLFNAVARADLKIETRSPHAWPSSYVEKGMDATVDWPSLDFRFTNQTDWPIFIVASYKDQRVTVDIYGMTLGDGVTVDLESKTIRTIAPPDEIKYVQNTSLPAGTRKTTIQPRTGYEVETWKIYYKNGQETERVQLCKSTYKAYQETIEYN